MDTAVETPSDYGFSIHYKTGDGKRISYTNDKGIHLTIDDEDTASLWAMVRSVELKINNFSWPHPRFEWFLGQITDARLAVILALGEES